jgi:hypothetical protein
METEFVEVKTAELVGAALDYAVALATGALVYPDGEPVEIHVATNRDSGGVYFWTTDHSFGYSPSTDWAHGGPLIERFIGAVSGPTPAREYSIACMKGNTAAARGSSMLIAACRAIVAAKLGDVVQVPSVLVGGEV